MALTGMSHARLDDAGLARLRAGATVVRSAPTVLRVEGPGAVACLQGLVTNDIEKPGPGTLTWNALLTPKGMIVLDLWVLRDATGLTLVADAAAREEALAIFARTLPPRLARVTDLTGTWEALWLLGEGAEDCWTRTTRHPLPHRGALAPAEPGGLVASGPAHAWCQAVLVAPAAAIAEAAGNLQAAGAVEGSRNEITAARVLAGWPALGAEIIEKTLPQEVRFDELDGVSYTKGCYLGQETVARVHFRGHPNRALRGVRWMGEAPLQRRDIIHEEKLVGTVRSVLDLPGRRLALALLRREVAPGATVVAGGLPAQVEALPFAEPATAA